MMKNGKLSDILGELQVTFINFAFFFLFCCGHIEKFDFLICLFGLVSGEGYGEIGRRGRF